MDPFVSCPYDPVHRVPLSRLQGHIVKCQKNFPKHEVCPYNATHRLPDTASMKTHIHVCPCKAAFFPEVKPNLTGKITTPKPILQKEYLPETDPNHEIWDD